MEGNKELRFCDVVNVQFDEILQLFTVCCHGASCMQANGAEGRKNDRLRKERKRENLAKVGHYLHGKRGGINSG